LNYYYEQKELEMSEYDPDDHYDSLIDDAFDGDPNNMWNVD
jgi:hypothetical protein